MSLRFSAIKELSSETRNVHVPGQVKVTAIFGENVWDLVTEDAEHKYCTKELTELHIVLILCKLAQSAFR